jgi:putative AbiEii toxin of type IV toxin-antitoxin system
MRLNSFTVEGYKNLMAPVTFGPLGGLHALHGPNNIGKSNLLSAIDLFFGLLAIGNQVSRDQFTTLDANEAVPGHSFGEIFNVPNLSAIRLQAELALPEQELRDANIEPECSTDPCTIALELTPVASGAQLRVTQFQMAKADVARDSAGPVGFAETLRAYIAGTFFLQTEQSFRPYALLDPYRPGSDGAIVPGLVSQRVRDDLFDARQSLDRQRRSRWSLFVRLMRELEPELGPGEFDTAFDRNTGRANLVFDTGTAAMPVDRLGMGIQRMVALVGSLVLARATIVGFGEPELGLTPSLQQRFMRALGHLFSAPGGPAQLLFTTHSPILGAAETAFGMSLQEGVVVLEQRPCEGSAALPSLWDSAPGADGEGPSSEDLDSLIGLVDQLAEIRPEALVAAAPASHPPLAAKASPAPPAPATPTAAPPPGVPPWKWQPKT